MNYTSDTYFLDFESPSIQDLIKDFKSDSLTDKDKTIGLYLKIRDGWRYNPYVISGKKEDYKASTIFKKEEGHCIDKSILLIAGLRALGIPARLYLAKVRNHIGVERLIEAFGTNEMTPHGMVEIFLNEKWLKATPAFNKELCEKCKVAPLEFDGEQDSIFQSYNKTGNLFMEYIEDYGHFEDVPLDFIINNMKTNYPQFASHFGGTEVLDITNHLR